MDKKVLIFSTIFLTLTLAVVSTVIAKSDVRETIENLIDRGLGVWRAHGFALQDFENYKWIQIRFLKIPWPFVSSNVNPLPHEFQYGRMWLDSQSYILKNIEFIPGAHITADVYLNDIQVGKLELERDQNRKPNIWTGILTFSSDSLQYHVYVHADHKIIPLNQRPTVKWAEKILNQFEEGE